MSSLDATQRAQATLQSRSTATAALPATITSNEPLLIDSLTSNTDGRWAEDETHCVFTEGSYHITVQQTDYLQPCSLLKTTIDQTAIQVDVSLLSGTNAGILLRLQGERFYDFEINNKGQFFFRRHDAGSGSYYTPLMPSTTSSAIAPTEQKNTLLVVADHNLFKLYINGTFVGEVHDSTYSSGQVALAAGTLAPQAMGMASFSNFKMFKVA
jgi:hypothetical protein